MKRGGCVCAIAATLSCALGGCTSLDEGARQEFSNQFTCPASSITVTERSDLDADEIEHGPPPKPPPEVAADPVRLDLWNKQHQPIHTGHTIYQAEGCNHEVFYSCGRSKKNNPMCFATSYHTSAFTKKSRLTVATIASASLEDQPVVIDAPGMVGDLQTFDVDANYDWASSIATAWSPDAKLWFVRVGHPSMDGTVDLSAKGLGSLYYQFNSPSKGDVDLMVDVGSVRGQRNPPVSVHTSKHADGTARNPITKPKCPLVTALTKARAAGGSLAKAELKYGLDFTLEAKDEKTTWITSAVIDGGSQWVRLDATTCQVAK
jgi:hypothetical protein